MAKSHGIPLVRLTTADPLCLSFLELVGFGGFVSIISVQLQCNQVRVGG
jgi:hypothetical protein